MNNRITQLFERKGTEILSVFFTAGYPELNQTAEIIETLVANGVDMIEIGIPYSEPNCRWADYSTQQRSRPEKRHECPSLIRTISRHSGTR